MLWCCLQDNASLIGVLWRILCVVAARAATCVFMVSCSDHLFFSWRASLPFFFLPFFLLLVLTCFSSVVYFLEKKVWLCVFCNGCALLCFAWSSIFNTWAEFYLQSPSRNFLFKENTTTKTRRLLSTPFCTFFFPLTSPLYFLPQSILSWRVLYWFAFFILFLSSMCCRADWQSRFQCHTLTCTYTYIHINTYVTEKDTFFSFLLVFFSPLFFVVPRLNDQFVKRN